MNPIAIAGVVCFFPIPSEDAPSYAVAAGHLNFAVNDSIDKGLCGTRRQTSLTLSKV